MTKFSGAFMVAATALVASANAVELTVENYEEMTEGKTVFIKFFAPWCGHCKAMAADWDKLGAAFEGHDVALIGEIDCTSPDGDSLCEQFNVEGFPTLKWGEASGPEDYDGGRDFGSMKAFADKYVTKPVCSVFKISECSEAEKASIAAVEAKSDDELMEVAHNLSERVQEAEHNFEMEVDKIQKKYEQLTEELNSSLDQIKEESNFKFLQQVMKKRELSMPSMDGDEDIPDDDDDDDDDNMRGEEL
mmetsp:Transcript_32798/g.77351  ORF Transcript_32798/g.77351 Transcript_32798/m.77351 type:complete len:247 (+) Transcript_32798:129-869(+)